MNFTEYLWYLAHRPLKILPPEESDVYKFFKPTGKVLDEVKEKIFLIRRQALKSFGKAWTGQEVKAICTRRRREIPEKSFGKA